MSDGKYANDDALEWEKPEVNKVSAEFVLTGFRYCV